MIDSEELAGSGVFKDVAIGNIEGIAKHFPHFGRADGVRLAVGTVYDNGARIGVGSVAQPCDRRASGFGGSRRRRGQL